MLGRAEKRKKALTQSSDATAPEFYDRYVAALDDFDIRLDNLHYIIGYIELHAHQRAEDAGKIDDITAVCREVCNSFGIPITVLPIIWRSYATLPLQDKGGEIYSLLLPRHANPRQYQPLIGHELGHALFDHVGRNEDYRRRVWELDETWGGEHGAFANYWNEWYPEFFCDACGVLTFGPAYVYALSDYLHNQRPFQLFQEHPPNALRLKYVEQLAQDVFPDLAIEQTRPVFEEIEVHLANQEQNKNEDYESYIAEELLTFVSDAACDEVCNQLSRITAVAHSDQPLEEVDPQIKYRVKVNRKWHQNGG